MTEREMTMEEILRDYASRGFSRQATSEVLEIPMYKLRKILESMPSIEWPKANCSLSHQDKFRAQKGFIQPQLAKSEEKRKIAHKMKYSYTVESVTGTIDELIAHFNVKVSASTVRRRMADGMTIENALFKPAIDYGKRWKGVNGEGKRHQPSIKRYEMDSLSPF